MAQTAEGTAQAPPLRVDVTLDEIEQSLKDQDATAAAGKVAADAKIAADAAAAAAPPKGADPQVAALTEALRISEEARRQLTTRGEAPAPTAPVAPPKLTKEQLAELMTKDPVAAVEYMQEEASRRVEDNVARRITPLIRGNEGTAETLAKQKYPDEFALFGKDIESFIGTLNNDQRSALSSVSGWDDLISWFRGRPGNFEKMVDHAAKKRGDAAAATAHAAQAASAGATIRSDVRTPSVTTDGQLDATEREIAKALNMTEVDYLKWKRVAP